MKEAIGFVNENTSLPFKVVVPIVMAIVGATVWIQSTLSDIKQSQRESVTRSELATWRNLLAERNRVLDVPYLEAVRHP